MLEILTLYISGFWIWLGITIGLAIVLDAFVQMFAVLIAGITGVSISLNSNKDKQ